MKLQPAIRENAQVVYKHDVVCVTHYETGVPRAGDVVKVAASLTVKSSPDGRLRRHVPVLKPMIDRFPNTVSSEVGVFQYAVDDDDVVSDLTVWVLTQ